MLGKRASPAQSELLKCLSDNSGAVQIAAAEALSRQDQTNVALLVLLGWIRQANDLSLNLQAGNVLTRLGEKARPVLPSIESALESIRKSKGNAVTGEYYCVEILTYLVATLHGHNEVLVYPKFGEIPQTKCTIKGLHQALHLCASSVPFPFLLQNSDY